MPVMNGFEAARSIREYERKNATNQTGPTRIIALTGLGAAASRQEATSSGINEFRVKPVPLKDLRRILES